jgi:tripartite-type tricarboxylate transporter receptor subunit TctC
VPYKGNIPAFADMFAGLVSVSFPTITSGLPPVRAGKLRGIALTSSKRSSIAPDLPTIAESGLPGYEATTWYGMLAPAGTPVAVVAKLYDAVGEVLKTSDMRDKLLAQGLEPVGSTPADFTATIAAEIPKWRRVVGATGVKVE